MGSLLGWWPLEGDGRDYSGNGLHGTLEGGAVAAAGVSGRGMNFPGNVGNCVAVPPLVMPVDFTVAMWVKSNAALFTNNATFFCYRGSTGYRPLVFVPLQNSGRINVYIGKFSPNSFSLGAWCNLSRPSSWTHIATTYNNATKVNNLLVDGRLVSTVKMTNLGDREGAAPAAPAYIGMDVSAPANRSGNYMLDDVRLYSVALGEADVRRVMLGLWPVGG